jgi:hypothetical protein
VDGLPTLKSLGHVVRLPIGVAMRRPRSLLAPAFLAFALLGTALVAAPAPAAAATKIAATTTCSNGVDNTGGLGLICAVTVENTITAAGVSSRTTVRECHGAAGNPRASCRTTVFLMRRLVTNVTQCNSSINGGGGTLRCSVRVINTWIGVKPAATSGTVNQCVGSGGGITTGCDPFPATTTGARITQCNGSANGGTLVGLTCTASGTKSATHGVRINQCNGSANGGGALVICSANVTNLIRTAPAATPTRTPAPAPRRTPTSGGTTTNGGTTTGPSSTPRLPETSTVVDAPASPGTAPLGLAAFLALFAATVLIVVGRQTARRTGRSNETPRSRKDT